MDNKLTTVPDDAATRETNPKKNMTGLLQAGQSQILRTKFSSLKGKFS